jgi:hypothetical protein
MPEKEKDLPTDWGYTTTARKEFGSIYQGRQLIGRDMDVRGGVYYGTYKGEAIVVDPSKNPEQYRLYFEKAKQRAIENGKIQRSKVLQAVFDTVSTEMPYSQEKVDSILNDIGKAKGLPQFPDGSKIDLGVFMENHAGVCRHQALACAVLLQSFKDEGYIRGDISVDRNAVWQPNSELDGHAWVRYTSHGGNVMILDVAQGYLGLLDDAQNSARWNYLRPEEQRTDVAQQIGNLVIPESAVA